MSVLDELQAEIAASQSNWQSVLKLPEGEKARIRFLANMDQILKVKVHGRFISGDRDAGYTVPCATNYKVDGMPRYCPFCQIPPDDDTGDKNHFCLPIWNYTAGMIQAFAFKANKASPLSWLAEYYENRKDQQGILGRDFTIKREGKGIKTTYIMDGLDQTPFRPGVNGLKIPTTKAEIDELLYKLLAEAWFPALLRRGDLIVPTVTAQQNNTPEKYDGPAAHIYTGMGQSNGQYSDQDLSDANDLLPNHI